MKCRLHTQNKYYRSESHNQIISCHKSRNNTDWFVVRTPNKDDSSPNYIFKNGDIIVLTHGLSNKNIHAA
jgi:dolichyl-phosphate-mannose--protein O-mannosyl transferase